MADTVYRTGYGTAAYGAQVYGLDGSIKEGASIVLGVSTTAAAGKVTIVAASVVLSTASIVSSAQRVRESTPISTPTASGTVAGRKKWEPESGTSEVWSEIDADDTVWYAA